MKNLERVRRGPMPSESGRGLRTRWQTCAFASVVCLVAIGLGCSSVSPTPATRSRPSDAVRVTELARHVRALTAPETEGRRTGTPGELVAARHLEEAFAAAGLVPAGSNGTWRHGFDFTAGVSLGTDNRFTIERPRSAFLETAEASEARRGEAQLDRDWRPLAFSRSGHIAPGRVVFVGYGLVAPSQGDWPAIDEYGDVDVTDRYVVAFRDLPQDLDDEQRRSLRRHAGLRYKAMIARDRGARGVLFVSGPRGRFENELAPLRFDAALSGTRIAVVSISDGLAERLLDAGGNSTIDLDTYQARVDAAFPRHPHSAPLPARVQDDLSIELQVDLETERARGTNVIGRLALGQVPSAETIVLGAHYDHLGRGESSGSLAGAEEADQIHPGADDNASGTALVVELARTLVERHRRGDDLGDRDFLFAAWSGEELGLLGSDAWLAEQREALAGAANPHGAVDHDQDAARRGPVAYLNFDMVGRLRDTLVVQGLGSSDAWEEILDRALRSAAIDFEVARQVDSYVPTDATSFYKQGVPILSAFTGAHSEYHTPRDTGEHLDLDGTARIGDLFQAIALELARLESPPTYLAQTAPATGTGLGQAGFRVYLGTIPDYARTDVTGVLLSGVAAKGPAEAAGLRRGDLIVEVGARTIENLYDYTFALEAMRVGESVPIVILRDGARIEVEVVPRSRD